MKKRDLSPLYAVVYTNVTANASIKMLNTLQVQQNNVWSVCPWQYLRFSIWIRIYKEGHVFSIPNQCGWEVQEIFNVCSYTVGFMNLKMISDYVFELYLRYSSKNTEGNNLHLIILPTIKIIPLSISRHGLQERSLWSLLLTSYKIWLGALIIMRYRNKYVCWKSLIDDPNVSVLKLHDLDLSDLHISWLHLGPHLWL